MQNELGIQNNKLNKICSFMLKRCNYCMILIIFIVNPSEFAYSSSQGTVTKGGSDCLCSSHRVAFALSSLLQTGGGERLSCNHLYVTSNFHVSNSALFIHTFNMCTPSTVCEENWLVLLRTSARR